MHDFVQKSTISGHSSFCEGTFAAQVGGRPGRIFFVAPYSFGVIAWGVTRGNGFSMYCETRRSIPLEK